MSTVSRVIRSNPRRSTMATWEFIVDLLTKGKDSEARRELLSVAGIAASIIADHVPKDAAIVAMCDGPRTRIYCLFDDDSLDADASKEEALNHDPMKGSWAISLPCPKSDLAWVQRELKQKSSRITARDMASALGEAEPSSKAPDFAIDLGAFLKS